MNRKLREYFQAGVRRVWLIDHRIRSAEVYSSAKRRKTIDENGILDAGDLLPGFRLPLHELLARAEGRPRRRDR